MSIRYGVYGLLIRDNAVLMVKTNSGGLAIWNFPGGGIEAGEDSLQALVRECREEIGAEVVVHELVYAPKEFFIHPTLGSKNVMTYHRISLAGETQIDYQLHGAQWFALDALPVEAMLTVDYEAGQLVCLSQRK